MQLLRGDVLHVNKCPEEERAVWTTFSRANIPLFPVSLRLPLGLSLRFTPPLPPKTKHGLLKKKKSPQPQTHPIIDTFCDTLVGAAARANEIGHLVQRNVLGDFVRLALQRAVAQPQAHGAESGDDANAAGRRRAALVDAYAAPPPLLPLPMLLLLLLCVLLLLLLMLLLPMLMPMLRHEPVVKAVRLAAPPQHQRCRRGRNYASGQCRQPDQSRGEAAEKMHGAVFFFFCIPPWRVRKVPFFFSLFLCPPSLSS